MSDLFNMDLDSGNEFLEDKKDGNATDGLFRPKAENALDKKAGYVAIIRFLPNITQEGKLGINAIEKITQYISLPDYPNLQGYYDSMKNFNEPCDLSNCYYKLDKSTNASDNERAKSIGRSIKWYSYIQVIEDKNCPENEGKIFVFQYGKKIKDMIAAEKLGNLTGDPCNVFKIEDGKDFRLAVTGSGQQTNYDMSRFFDSKSSIKLKAPDGKMKAVPTEIVTDSNGVEKVVIVAKAQPAVLSYIMDRTVELESFAPVRWDEKTQDKINQIVAILTNSPKKKASAIAESSEYEYQDEAESVSSGEPVDGNDEEDDFFFDGN